MVHVLIFILAGFPLASAAYVRPEARVSTPSAPATFVCNNPVTTTPCSGAGYYANFPFGMEPPDEYLCQYAAGGNVYTGCSYNRLSGVGSYTTSPCPSSQIDPAPVTTCTSTTDSSVTYVCNSPTLGSDGTTVNCANNMRRRNGVSRSPAWIKSRQASLKSKKASKSD